MKPIRPGAATRALYVSLTLRELLNLHTAHALDAARSTTAHDRAFSVGRFELVEQIILARVGKAS